MGMSERVVFRAGRLWVATWAAGFFALAGFGLQLLLGLYPVGEWIDPVHHFGPVFLIIVILFGVVEGFGLLRVVLKPAVVVVTDKGIAVRHLFRRDWAEWRDFAGFSCRKNRIGYSVGLKFMSQADGAPGTVMLPDPFYVGVEHITVLREAITRVAALGGSSAVPKEVLGDFDRLTTLQRNTWDYHAGLWISRP